MNLFDLKAALKPLMIIWFKCIGIQLLETVKLLYCNQCQSAGHLCLPSVVLWRQASTAAAR